MEDVGAGIGTVAEAMGGGTGFVAIGAGATGAGAGGLGAAAGAGATGAGGIGRDATGAAAGAAGRAAAPGTGNTFVHFGHLISVPGFTGAAVFRTVAHEGHVY